MHRIATNLPACCNDALLRSQRGEQIPVKWRLSPALHTRICEAHGIQSFIHILGLPFEIDPEGASCLDLAGGTAIPINEAWDYSLPPRMAPSEGDSAK